MRCARTGHRVPDFLIVGAARSGTTTLYYYLRQHPQIFMPDHKEPFYFSFMGEAPPAGPSGEESGRITDLSSYASLFEPAAEGQLLGEASTSYLYLHERSIQNILDFYGERAKDLRIFGILRNPIERTYSNYLLLIRNGWDDLSFDQYLDTDFCREQRATRWDYDYEGLGRYSAAVKHYLEVFPHCRFYLHEDLAEPARMLGEIHELLGLEQAAAPLVELQSNAAGVPRGGPAAGLLELASKLASPLARRLPAGLRSRAASLRERLRRRTLQRPQLQREQREFLIRVFEEDVRSLEALLGRDLSGWLEPSGAGPTS